MSKQTDKQRVLNHMREHGSITSWDAIREFGCTRLGARIWDLRHEGFNIDTEIIHGKDRNGEDVRFAKYTLRGEDDAQTTLP